MVSSRLLGRVIDFVTLLFLARVLTPGDFGLVALASTLVSIADTVLEVPLMQALTRLRSVDRAHLDTAFTLGLLRAFALAVVTLAASHPLAALYGDPRLATVAIALSLAPVLRGLVNPLIAEFYRQFDFRRTFIAEISGKILAALLATALAVSSEAGFWAIVVNNVAACGITTFLSYALAPFRPRISFSKLSDFYGFIGWFSASQLVSAINWQLDRFLLGRFVSKADVGRFTMASDLAVLPTQSLIGPAMSSVMAAFATIAHDRQRLQAAYLKVSKLTMLIAMPMCCGIALTSDLIVSVLLGDKWVGSEHLLRWLVLPVFLNAYFQPIYSMSLAMDRPRTIFNLNVVDLVIRVAVTLPLLVSMGLDGVIGARAFTSAAMFLLCMMAAKRLVGVGLSAQLANLWQISAACGAMVLAVAALRGWLDGGALGAVFQLLLIPVAGASIYGLALLSVGLRVKSFA